MVIVGRVSARNDYSLPLAGFEPVTRSCASFVGSAKPTVDCWLGGSNTRNTGRRINTKEQTTHKAMKKPVETMCISETEEFCVLCLRKRQQSSSAVMFARLRSNRRYKPGDQGREIVKKTKVICGALE